MNFPIKGDKKNCTIYSVPKTGPNWLGVAPFLVASMGKNGALTADDKDKVAHYLCMYSQIKISVLQHFYLDILYLYT